MNIEIPALALWSDIETKQKMRVKFHTNKHTSASFLLLAGGIFVSVITGQVPRLHASLGA